MTYDHEPTIVVVSGASSCGKTTLCLKVAEAARRKGLSVRGIISPPRIVGGMKVGIDALDVSSSERRLLADAHVAGAGPATACWRFDAGTLAWGMDVLRRAVPDDLLLIDELGPLELLRGEGWAEAISLLQAGGYRWGLVVVRPALVGRFLHLLPAMRATVVTVSMESQAALLDQITGMWQAVRLPA